MCADSLIPKSGKQSADTCVQQCLLEDVVSELCRLSSGGDFPNWWCDIISDEQDGYGFLLEEAYRQAVVGMFIAYIRRLPELTIDSLWLETEKGREYAFEKRWQEERRETDEKELAQLYGRREERIETISINLVVCLRDLALETDLEGEIERADEHCPRLPFPGGTKFFSVNGCPAVLLPDGRAVACDFSPPREYFPERISEDGDELSAEDFVKLPRFVMPPSPPAMDLPKDLEGVPIFPPRTQFEIWPEHDDTPVAMIPDGVGWRSVRPDGSAFMALSGHPRRCPPHEWRKAALLWLKSKEL